MLTALQTEKSVTGHPVHSGKWLRCPLHSNSPVSYTHLDVYKRQVPVAATIMTIITITMRMKYLQALAWKQQQPIQRKILKRF